MSAFQKIEVPNAYRGTIVDAVAGKTKNGFPQAILRLKAEEAANDKGEFEKLESSAQITTYLVLFNSTEVFNEQTQNLNYPQLRNIGGWEDAKFSFAEIAKLTGKKAFFRTEEKEYQGKTAMQVVWIDDYESEGTTTLRAASDADIKALDSLLKFAGAQGGLPGSAPVTAKRGRPAKKEAPAENPTALSAVQTNTTAPAPAISKSAPPEPVSDPNPDLPKEITKTQAWEYVNEQCAAHGDDAIANAWLAAIKKIGGDAKTYTPAQWAIVRDTVVGLLIPY